MKTHHSKSLLFFNSNPYKPNKKSQTKIEKEFQKHLNAIITSLNENEETLEFRFPVDYKSF